MTTALEVIGAAGLWGLGGVGLGLSLALLLAPLAARWTGGGWAAGCAWGVLLAVGLGAAGLYAGATYGVARRTERLVQEEWLLERVAATALLTVAEERGLEAGGVPSMAPAIAGARERLDTYTAAGAFPGAAILGPRIAELAGPVLEAFERVDRLEVEDLRALRLGAGPAAAVDPREAPLPAPVADMLDSTASIRARAVAAVWATALPHLVVAGGFAAACLALVVVIGVVSRLLRHRRGTGGVPGTAQHR